MSDPQERSFEFVWKELDTEVRRHITLYQKGIPEIPDHAFDRMEEKLRKWNPEAPALSILGDPPKSDGIRHLLPMRSLDKVKEGAELDKWLASFKGDVVVTPKVDGVALSLYYDSDLGLYKAGTRGNGLEGETVTLSGARKIKNVPVSVSQKTLIVRGEVFIPKAVMQAKYPDMKSARNLAAGILLEKGEDRKEDLVFLAYFAHGLDAATEIQLYTRLTVLGFACVAHRVVAKPLVCEEFTYWGNARIHLPYEVDGIVVKANSIAEQKRMGFTTHHPKHSVAVKFEGVSEITTLRAVEWSVGRTSVITPVAVFDPVTIDDADLTRSSLHNLRIFLNLELCIGDRILVSRRGGVIPQVEKNFGQKGVAHTRVTLPLYCPSCGGNADRKGDFLYCTSPEKCKEARYGVVGHWCSAIGMEGWGDALIKELVDRDMVHRLPDLYKLESSDLRKIPRVGIKKAAKLLDSLEGTKRMTFSTFLAALGIPGVGLSVAKKIAEEYSNITRLLMSVSLLGGIDGIGGEILANTQEFLDRNLDMLMALHCCVEVIKSSGGPLSKTHFVFTGSVDGMKRTEAIRKVTDLGGTVHSSFPIGLAKSGVEVHLVYGGDTGSVKYKMAKSLQEQSFRVKLVTGSEFLALLEE